MSVRLVQQALVLSVQAQLIAPVVRIHGAHGIMGQDAVLSDQVGHRSLTGRIENGIMADAEPGRDEELTALFIQKMGLVFRVAHAFDGVFRRDPGQAQLVLGNTAVFAANRIDVENFEK